MTKRLISLVLALIMILSMCMTACSTGETTEEGEADVEEEDVQRKNLALTIYAITNDKTTEAGLARVEEKISYYTQAKFKTVVDLRFVTADKYQASLESMYDKFAAEEAEKKKQEEEAKISASIEASKKAQMTKEERQKYEQQKRLEAKEAAEKAEQAAKEEAELIASGKDVAAVKDVQMDIIYIPGMAEYYDYVEQGLIIELSSFLNGKFKNINDYVFPSYMTAAAIDGVVYGIPNNQAITTSETYFVVNKALAEKYNVDFSKVKSITDLNGVYEQIKANENGVTPIYGDFEPEGLTYYEDSTVGILAHTTCAFSDTFVGGRYSAANTYSALKPDSTQSTAILDYCATKNYYRKNGIISDTNENFFLSVQELSEAEKLAWEEKGYMTVLYKGADFNTEAALNTGLFGISKHCKDPERAMELIQLMTTDSGMRNLLAFGVEEEHYIVDAGNDNVITIIDDSYSMDFDKSGNALIGYVPDTMDPDYVEKAKAKNLNSHLNPFLGFRYDWKNPENAKWVALAKEWEAYIDPIYAQLRAGELDNYEEVLTTVYDAIYANEAGQFTDSYRTWQTECSFRNTYKTYTKTLQTLSDFLHVEETEVVNAAE